MARQAKSSNVNNYDPALAMGFPVPLSDLDTTAALDGMVVTYQSSTDMAIWAGATGGSSNPNTSPVYSVGSAANFASIAGSAQTFTATGITITGNSGETTLTGTATYIGGSNFGVTAPYAQAVLDVATLKGQLIALSGTAITTPSALESNNLSSLGAGVFAPGIYTTAAAIGMTASNTITLDGAGDYVFVSTGGAITFGANDVITLVNGATAARVFWVASTDLSTTGASSTLVGNFLVRDATVASTATINGRILASRNVVIAGVANSITLPGGVPVLVTAASLSAGILPSHVVKFAGKKAWTGSGASLAYTVTGVLSTDIVIASINTVPSQAAYLVSAAPTTDTVTFVLSAANTGNDAVIAFEVLRAIA